MASTRLWRAPTETRIRLATGGLGLILGIFLVFGQICDPQILQYAIERIRQGLGYPLTYWNGVPSDVL